MSRSVPSLSPQRAAGYFGDSGAAYHLVSAAAATADGDGGLAVPRVSPGPLPSPWFGPRAIRSCGAPERDGLMVRPPRDTP